MRSGMYGGETRFALDAVHLHATCLLGQRTHTVQTHIRFHACLRRLALPHADQHVTCLTLSYYSLCLCLYTGVTRTVSASKSATLSCVLPNPSLPYIPHSPPPATLDGSRNAPTQASPVPAHLPCSAPLGSHASGGCRLPAACACRSRRSASPSQGPSHETQRRNCVRLNSIRQWALARPTALAADYIDSGSATRAHVRRPYASDTRAWAILRTIQACEMPLPRAVRLDVYPREPPWSRRFKHAEPLAHASCDDPYAAACATCHAHHAPHTPFHS